MSAAYPAESSHPPVTGVLGHAAAITDDHITLDVPVGVSEGYIAIEPWSINCEVRAITSVSGSTVNFGISGFAGLSKAHAVDATVYFFTGNEVPLVWWNAPTGGTTDAEPHLQAAIQSLSDGLLLSFNGIWINGGSNSFGYARPVFLSNLTHLRAMTLKPLTTFAPADPNGATLMTYRGTVGACTFTASASTNTFTTNIAHGLNVGDQVAVKGSVPGGVTEGQVYWVQSAPTTSTFTIATTAGGSVVDLTSDGAGTTYGPLQALCRLYLEQVYVQAPNTGSLTTATLNGIRANLQQPSVWRDVRFDRFNQYGIWLSGQQCVFHNIELLQNRVGLAIDNAKFMWFYGFDPEQQIEAGYRTLTSASLFGGSCSNIAFYGVHFENSGGEWAFDLAGTTRAFSIDNIYGYTNLLWCHTGAVTTSSYRMSKVRLNGLHNATWLQDDDRGVTKTIPTSSGNFYPEDVSAPLREDDGNADDEGKYEVTLPDGGYIRYGAARDGSAKFTQRSGSNQTGNLAVWRNTSGTDTTWIDKDAILRSTSYRQIQRFSAKLLAANITQAGDYTVGVSVVQLPALVGQSSMLVYLDAGVTTLRIGVACGVNDTAPARTLIFGLYPVGTPSGAVNVFNPNLGTVIAGSIVTFTTPAANSKSVETVTADFASPGAGWYCPGINASGAFTANSLVEMPYRIEAKNT